VHPIIQRHNAELADLCRRFDVQRLDLFGSATGDNFEPTRSDVDLLVEFVPESTLKALDQYFGLKEALEALFERRVDLVMASAVKNPYIWKSIEETRETLYAA
jgi:predicted nucleotidyltransferase